MEAQQGAPGRCVHTAGFGVVHQQPPLCLLDRCRRQGSRQLAQRTEKQLLQVGRSTSPPTRGARGWWTQAYGQLPAWVLWVPLLAHFVAPVLGTESKVGGRYLGSVPGFVGVGGQRAGGMKRATGRQDGKSRSRVSSWAGKMQKSAFSCHCRK